MTDICCIYHVEDNRLDSKMLAFFFREWNEAVAIQQLDDGELALEIFAQVKSGKACIPSAIVLDLNLPKISGIEVLEQLRQDVFWNGIPVIVLTSSENVADRLRTESLGIDAYYTKSGDLETLSGTAVNILNIAAKREPKCAPGKGVKNSTLQT